jgi:hypothetical protein
MYLQLISVNLPIANGEAYFLPSDIKNLFSATFIGITYLHNIHKQTNVLCAMQKHVDMP